MTSYAKQYTPIDRWAVVLIVFVILAACGRGGCACGVHIDSRDTAPVTSRG